MAKFHIKNAKKSGADRQKVADNGVVSGENDVNVSYETESAEPRRFGVEAKAEYIIKNGLSDKSYKTLRGKSNAELDAIIENGGEMERPTASPDSVKIVINAYLDICEAIKKSRCDEGISENLRTLCQKSVPHIAARAESKTINFLILGAGLLALVLVLIDAFAGLENLKKLIKKDKLTQPVKNINPNPTPQTEAKNE